MAAVQPSVQRFVCQLCRANFRSSKRARPSILRPSSRMLMTTAQRPLLSLPSKPFPSKANLPKSSAKPAVRPPVSSHVSESSATRHPAPARAAPVPTFSLQTLVEDVTRLLSNTTQVPTEKEVLELLKRCNIYAEFAVSGQTYDHEAGEQATRETGTNPASSLLDLDETSSSKPRVLDMKRSSTARISSPEEAANTFASMTYDLLCAPTIYITRPMLDCYVRIHFLLGTPQYLPQIFHLYANKPIRKPGTSPVKYTLPSPKSIRNAIPPPLASTALDAAISKKDLPLAISIIETTTGLSASRRNRFLRRAALPVFGLTAIPLGLYQIANSIAEAQVAWDPEMSKFITISATCAWLSTLACTGYVAVTTYNDHHDRVVWRPGINMRERWMREDERWYFDRIAVAWGFKEKWRRGEESGEEWDALREHVGVRGMILDKTEFLEGMQ